MLTLMKNDDDDFEDDKISEDDDDFAGAGRSKDDELREKSRKSGHKEAAETDDRRGKAAENDVLDFLAHILSDLEIHGTMASTSMKEDTLHIDVEGDELGHAIGRGSEAPERLTEVPLQPRRQQRPRPLPARRARHRPLPREKNIRNASPQKHSGPPNASSRTGKPYRMPPMNAAGAP